MDCPVSLETTLGEVGDEILMQLGTRRFPLAGSFELTERCNLACLHCFINQPAASRDAAAGELTLTQVRSILDKLAGAGCQPGQLKLIVLTHGDVDHAGNAAYLREKYGAPIASHAAEMGVVWLAASGFGPWLRAFQRHATSSFAALDESI